ncbi:hypothetical protein V491_06575 [Pseudogymnoascus sp. VKM F-3775]|nr:hypothetical protein V491_06575 [Pseudogymnoascus sp. VKM F-3775]
MAQHTDTNVVYSMVKSLSAPDLNYENIAIYAGIMVSVFTFGEFVGAPQWAKISDRIARKPTILIGSIGAVFSAPLFGFSTSLPIAIATRLCAGLLNPNLGVVQTFVGELVGTEQQADGFSVVPSLRGAGTIIGPVIGGYRAEPVKNYPFLFQKGTIWDKFPFLLPNIVVVIFLLSSCILGLFFMEEVHPKYHNQVDIRWTLTGQIQNIFRGKGWKTDEGIYTLRADETDVEASQSPESATEALEYPEAKPPSAFIRQVKLQILSISIQGFLKISTLVIVPIFLATPSDPNQSQNLPGDSEIVKGILGIKGGFELDTISTSNILLSQAAVVVIAQARLIPAIIDRYRPLQSFRAAIVVLLYLYWLLPFTANLAPRIGMPNLQTRHPHPSTWQPTATSLGCLARTLGPTVSGPLFKFGLQAGNVGLPFWFLGVVTGIGGVVSFYLIDYS